MELAGLDIPQLHDDALSQWYERGAPEELPEGEGGYADVRAVAEAQHFCNFRIWGLEDEARRRDVPDSYVAEVKRSIDSWNQRRNDLVESLDERLLADLAGVDTSAAVRHSETAGAIVDRLSILALKIHHMGVNAARTGEPEIAEECRGKLGVLERQRGDLAECLGGLLRDCAEGRRFFTLYRQYKAYNDARLNPALYGNRPGPAR